MALSQQELKDIESILGRKPSEVETSIFDTMWSEHCSYKSSKPLLKLLPTKGKDVALGIGEDSGIVRFVKHDGIQYCIAISHESHNHPSQILPVEGAATGVGGVVRDVYCMGADVVGVLNSLHFGIDTKKDNPLIDEIAREVVQGVCDYANPLGVPVLGGETLYHESYNDNCLVNVAALGLVEESKIIHSYTPQRAKDEPYDVILIGKSTDATGYGGASFSSATLDKEDEKVNLGAVQVHDPFIKRVTVEALKHLFELIEKDNVDVGFKDLGAGGISCATSELASSGGFGIEVSLDKVNVVSPHLPPEVIACSETQERFCIVVPRWFSNTVLDVFNKTYDLPSIYPQAGAVVIGEILQDPTFVMTYKGESVCNLPVSAITTDVRANRVAKPFSVNVPDTTISLQTLPSIKDVCSTMLSSLNGASKRYVYRFFDQGVRGDFVVYPGEADAVVVTPVAGSDAGLAATMDSNLYGEVDPYVSGAAAVSEAVRNIVAVGAKPLAVTDCLNFGNPEKPEAFYQFEQAVKGIADACHGLGFDEDPLPVISGNVSLYNESKQGNAIVPSPVIAVIGRIDDYKRVSTLQLNDPGHTLIVVGKRYAEYGGCLVTQLTKTTHSKAPLPRFNEEKQMNKAIYELINKSKLSAVHDISAGGLWMAVCEMTLGERGFSRVGLDLSFDGSYSLFDWLFSESGGYVISVDAANREAVQRYLEAQALSYHVIGQTTAISASNQATIRVQSELGALSFETEALSSQWNSRCMPVTA